MFINGNLKHVSDSHLEEAKKKGIEERRKEETTNIVKESQ
jgi:hypothetical protein